MFFRILLSSGVLASLLVGSRPAIATDYEFVRSVGTIGTGNGQLSLPAEVAVDSSGNIWVTDTDNNRIESFDSSGAWRSTVGTGGSGNGQFSYPYGVATDSSGNIWVGDTYNSRIQEFDNGGTLVKVFGGNGQIVHPFDLAVDSGGNIWTPDWENNRIREYNGSGTLVKTFGSVGSGNGQFNGPARRGDRLIG